MTDTILLTDQLTEITQRIVDLIQPERIILFGSYARGDYDQDSDIDLMVVVEGVTSTRVESNRIRQALRGLLAPVDVIVATPDQVDRYKESIGMIYRSVLREGKVIYDRSAVA